MSGAIPVRAARADEFPLVAKLTVAAYDADGQLGGTGYASVLADVAGRAAHGEVLVATGPAQELLGAVTVVRPGTRYAEISVPGEIEFRMLAVDPSAQGRGVGAALVRACLDRGAELGAGAVVLCVRDTSVRARRLYERLGFVRTPELDWTPVPGVSLLAMRRALATPPAPGPR